MGRLISGLGSIHRVVPFREDRVSIQEVRDVRQAFPALKEASLFGKQL